MKATKQPGRGSDQFPLRLPDGLRDRIKLYAERNGRSMNAEIVAVLMKAYPGPNEALMKELDFVEEIDSIQRQLERLRVARLARDELEEIRQAITSEDDQSKNLEK